MLLGLAQRSARKKQSARPQVSLSDEGDLTEEEIRQAIVDYKSRRAEWEQKQKGK